MVIDNRHTMSVATSLLRIGLIILVSYCPRIINITLVFGIDIPLPHILPGASHLTTATLGISVLQLPAEGCVTAFQLVLGKQSNRHRLRTV